MFGLGGVFVEVFEDVTFRVPPFDAGEARRMIDEVRGSALLHGARGRPKGDVKALVDTIMKVQRLAVDTRPTDSPSSTSTRSSFCRRASSPSTRSLVARRWTRRSGRTAIVGIGQTEFAKSLDRSEKRLALEAIKLALDDAGIDPSEVDGLASYTLETTEEVDIARNLGLGDITFFSQVGYGGGAGCGVVGHAAMAVATGQCNVAVAWRQPQARRGGQPAVVAGRRTASAASTSGLARSGCCGRSTRSRVLARRYFHEFGGTREQLADGRGRRAGITPTATRRR